jgi:serine/threonine protein kinase
VEQLRRELPDEYALVPNLELADPRGGQSFDYDLVVVAPHGVYAVEIKDLRGDVRADEREWLVDGESVRSPVIVTQRKARVLKSRLVDRTPALAQVWVEALVVLARRPAALDIDEAARPHVVLLGDAAAVLCDPSALGFRRTADPFLADEVLRALNVLGRGQRGPLVFRDYVVERTLDQEEGSARYLARNRLMPQAPPVLLRVVSLSAYDLPADELERRRAQLAREAEALQRMGTHPNLVGARDAFTLDDGRVVTVHDFLRGRSLRSRIGSGTPLTLEERLDILLAVARALDHAHAHGVVHRRVEPARVFLADDGGVRLTGFGLARIVEAEAQTVWVGDALAGVDPAFAAPELAMPGLGPVGPAADVYGLGAIAWALLAGRVPDGSQSGSGLPELPPEVPSELRDMLPRMVARDQANRPADAEIVAAFEGALATPARPPIGTSDKTEYATGEVIDRRFQVRAELGRGGFSRVYRVYDAFLDDEFALKLFLGSGDNDFERCQREIRVLRSLARSPNIVEPVWAARTGAGHWYLVSELVVGQPLSDFVRGDRRLSPQEAVETTRQVLAALQSIHPNQDRIDELKAMGELTGAQYEELQRLEQIGIVHRDIKPENVILAAGRGAVLIDFNIASSAGASPVTVSGTPPYMPPDVGWNAWTPDVDLFATGVLLYELLCHAHPYPDGQPRADREPADPRTYRPELAPALAELLLRACAPHASERFHTARQLREALEAVGDPVLSTNGFGPPLPQELLALLDAAPPNVNPIVGKLLELGSQARRTNRGTRGLDVLALATYVETQLDGELADAALGGRHRLVVISGNAGDGKTAFIQRLEGRARERGATLVDRGANGSTIAYAGKTILTLYDGSQDEDERTSDDVLRTFLTPFAARAVADDAVRVAAVNEGRLRDFVMAHRDEFPQLLSLIEQLDHPAAAAAAHDLVVVNLNLRSATLGGQDSIFSRQVRAIVGPDAFWGPCRVCDYKLRCPLKHNVDTFRDPTSGPLVTERLRRLVDVVRMRRRRHLTMRDVRSLISFVLFRDRECREVPEILSADDPLEIVDLAYFQGAAGIGVPEGSEVDRGAQLLTEVDIAAVANPDLDSALASGRGPRLADFAERESEAMRERVARARERAGAGYGANVAYARASHEAHRRLVFFERNDDAEAAMLPYRRLLELEAALERDANERRDALVDHVLRAISIARGVSSETRLREGLWLRTLEASDGVFPSYRCFTRSTFELRAVALTVPYIESEADALELVHGPSDARLRLDLDLLEVLDRLSEGFVPSPEEARGLLINLTLFEHRLLATPAEELVVLDGDDAVRIGLGAQPGAVALTERV